MISEPLVAHIPGGRVRRVPLPSVALAVEVGGEDDRAPVLLLHGFPHTRAVWREAAAALITSGRRVIVPDLRGLGDSERPADGYGARVGAADMADLLDVLGVERAHVVGIDLGVATAFGLAAWHSARVASLTLIEGFVGALPGAEAMLTGGGPWWFGFHQAPGDLAADVIDGDVERYLGFFFGIGSMRGIPDDLAKIIVTAYSGRESLRAAFAHYAAFPADAADFAAWGESGRLEIPVLTVGARPIGDLTRRQVAPFAARLTAVHLEESGHIVPIDAPDRLARAIAEHADRVEDA